MGRITCVEFAGYGSCAADDLADAIARLSALGAAVHAERLRLVAAYDATEAWRADGVGSMEDWLVARLGVARHTAGEQLRVAGALTACPALAAVHAAGRHPPRRPCCG